VPYGRPDRSQAGSGSFCAYGTGRDGTPTPAERIGPEPDAAFLGAALDLAARCADRFGGLPAVKDAVAVKREACPSFFSGLDNPRARCCQSDSIIFPLGAAEIGLVYSRKVALAVEFAEHRVSLIPRRHIGMNSLNRSAAQPSDMVVRVRLGDRALDTPFP